VAAALGLKVMPTMDAVCFVGSDKSNTNFMSITLIDKTPYAPSRDKFKELIKQHPKLAYSIVQVLGDYYYKPLTGDLDKIVD